MGIKQINAWAVDDVIFLTPQAAETHYREKKLSTLMQGLTKTDIIELLAKGKLLADIVGIVE